MLRNIPACISPDLMHALMTMGHGEEIILCDADFPAATTGRRIIRADGLTLAPLLEAILPFFPLDSFVPKPAAMMDCRDWDADPVVLYESFRQIIRKHVPKFTDFELVKRFDFYERARAAYALVVTSEPDGNIILKKGPVMM